jgi:hypothetical protein
MSYQEIMETLQKLDDAELAELWCTHVKPDIPKRWQMLEDIAGFADSDSDIEEAVMKEIEEIKQRQDCEANGFENVPAECEDRDCATCEINNYYRKKIDCPYAEDRRGG